MNFRPLALPLCAALGVATLAVQVFTVHDLVRDVSALRSLVRGLSVRADYAQARIDALEARRELDYPSAPEAGVFRIHDIYTGVRGRNGQLCCGGTDCAATRYRERGGDFEFLTREGDWVAIPAERITFLPVPGDAPASDGHRAHLCYRAATDGDRTGYASGNVFGPILLYCAFIPPGAI